MFRQLDSVEQLVVPVKIYRSIQRHVLMWNFGLSGKISLGFFSFSVTMIVKPIYFHSK